MKIINIINWIAKGNKNLFDISANKQSNYLNTFREPLNDFQRSYFQYKCQGLFIPVYLRFILNVLSFILLPFFIIYTFIKKYFYSSQINKTEVILEKSSHVGIIPKSISDKYLLNSEEWNKRCSFSHEDIKFIMNLIPFFFKSPYFVLKIIYKLAYYSYMIRHNKPTMIITHNEFSFTSSILTHYCEMKGVKHYNVMHGEKLFNIRDSFFRFTKTYVWDKYYVSLFFKLRAAPNQFIVELPPFMKIKPQNHLNDSLYSNYKYYLASYNEDQLKSIIKSLSFIKLNGKTLKYRPHPRYSNLKILIKYIPQEEIEDPKDVNIIDSISNLDYAIGSFSTVLNQVVNAGKSIIMDDVTYNNNYIKLKDLDYILSKKEYPLLSNYQSK